VDPLGSKAEDRGSLVFRHAAILTIGDAEYIRICKNKTLMASSRSRETLDRILVADDEPAVRQLFAEVLRGAGFDVTAVGSGKETLAALRSAKFRLLILDLNMPDLDGFDVLKEVRKAHPGIPVIVISGYMDGALLEAAQCLGATTTIAKATATRHLVATVKKLLGEPTAQE
jgi:CheY-like chemotaxis protein